MPSEHIVKAYDEELRRLSNPITEMGGLAESQLATAIDAVVKRDSARNAQTLLLPAGQPEAALPQLVLDLVP